jgi:hypothetical protein
MLNKSFYIILILVSIFCSCQKTPSSPQVLRAGDMEVLWLPSLAQIKTTELLHFEFTVVHPLGSSIEVHALANDNFELFELQQQDGPPASPTQLRSHVTLSFEPPAPGQYKTPQLSILLKNSHGLMSQLKSPEHDIEILSISPPEDFRVDHQGSLKERPSKWLLLSLIFLALPFLPRKKKAAEKIIFKVTQADLDECTPDFKAIEGALVRIMRYNFLIKADDFNKMLAKLSNDDSNQARLKDFIDDYQTQRFSNESANPNQVLAELKKLFAEICP